MFSVWNEAFSERKRKKLVVGKNGNIILLSSQLPVIFATTWNSPTLRILKHQLQQLKYLGDEGMNCALFGCRILTNFEQFRNPPLGNCALSYIAQYISEYREFTKNPSQAVQVKTLVNMASNHLHAKLRHYLSEKEIQHLSIVLSESVLQSLGCTLKCALLPGDVKYSKVMKGLFIVQICL